MDKKHSNCFQFESEIPWDDRGNGIQRQVYGYNEQMMLVKVKFDKGAVGNRHSHPHTQITYVRGGVFEMTIGDQTRIIRDGDGYYVPPGVAHGVVCLEPGILVDCFAPIREDFL